ncbi:ankyrin, partial [Anaeromyces robustus]
SSGNEDIVKYLIEHRTDINKENIYGYTPLFNACSSGNEDIVKYLIEHRTDINKENIYGYTPL